MSRPSVTFHSIGSVSRPTGDGVTSFGQESTDLHICARCGAVVADDWREHHVAWHAGYSLEKWDDVGPFAPEESE